jgi:hypothetical protein
VGIVAITPGRPLVVMTFTTTMRGRITGIDVLADPGHVRHLDLAVLPD